MSQGKAVKFQHRVATGKAILGKPFQVEEKDPFGDQKVKKQFRHHTSVPTELQTVDAIILAAYPAKEGEEPRVTLIYANGTAMMGADWHNSLSVEHDVPHRDHDGAEESERFWFDELEAANQSCLFLAGQNESLRAQLANTTEGRDLALQALADAGARKPVEPAPAPPQPPADPDVTTLLDAAPAAPAEPAPPAQPAD